MRQVWFARLRWIVPPVVVALGFLVELLTRQRLFPALPAMALAAFAAGAQRRLSHAAPSLRRQSPSAHARELRAPGARAGARRSVGRDHRHPLLGRRDAATFWPFLTLTVMASALFFARRAFVAIYATRRAALMCWLVCVLDGGGWLPPSALMLASLLSMVALICAFYAERMAESRALAKTKDEILSRVTHELRTPLSALRGFVYLAQKRERRSRRRAATRRRARSSARRCSASTCRSIGSRAW